MKEHHQSQESRLYDLPANYLKIPDLLGIWSLRNVCPLFPQLRNTLLPALGTKTVMQIFECTMGITRQDTDIKYLLVTKSHSGQRFPGLGLLLAVDLMMKTNFLINLLSTQLQLSSILQAHKSQPTFELCCIRGLAL